VTRVVIPHGNLRDVAELPEHVRTSVHFQPVRLMDEALALALRGGMPALAPGMSAVTPAPVPAATIDAPSAIPH
jgi:predicted ATP-dependent protease